MTNNRYEPELKQKVLRLYLEEGRTKKSLTEEYNLGQGTLTYWLQQYRKECDNSPTKREESDSYEVAKKLRKEIDIVVANQLFFLYQDQIKRAAPGAANTRDG